MKGFVASGMTLCALIVALAVAPAAGARSITHTPPAHAADYVVVENAHSGSHFGATNTPNKGGSIYQDVAVNTSPGQTICGSAWVRSEVPDTGGSGTFALFLFGGGGATDSGGANFSSLGFGDAWTHVHTCVEATGSHTTVRIQLYPTPGGPTVEMDDVQVNASLAADGGFEAGGAWTPYPGTATNYAVYANAPGAPPARSGSHFGATNTPNTGGSIYQDVAINTSPGQTICGSAWVRTETPATGGSGTFALFLFGGSGATDSGGATFSGLPNGNNWTQVHTCVEATTSHTTLRIQLYPTPGGPTVEIDDVNVTVSLAANGGFETGGGPWTPYPGTATNYAVYANGQVRATIVTPTPVQPTPQPTPIPVPKGRHALKIKLALSWTWRHATTRLTKVKVGRFPHRTHFTLTCRGKGCPRPLKLTAAGPKHIHAALKRIVGHRYRAGDVLTVTFTARGWTRERARIRIRNGRLPRVTAA